MSEYTECHLAVKTARFVGPHPCDTLKQIANTLNCDITDGKFAQHMDEHDPLKDLRQEFFYPKMKDVLGADLSIVDPEEDCVYFCGNSLGYFQGEGMPWSKCHEKLDVDMAKLVGGRPGEVAIMNGLTVNLHLLLISFYRPTPKRHKIMCESKAFPSDQYTFQSQINLHGYDMETSLLLVEPREGEIILRTEDILAKIEEEGESIALICFSGVQFYTGQLLDIPTITRAGHSKGSIWPTLLEMYLDTYMIGTSILHVGVPTRFRSCIDIDPELFRLNYGMYSDIHQRDREKPVNRSDYINSSAGCLACIFLHEKHKHNNFPKLLGWWGQRFETRFNMNNDLDMCPGAYGYRISNPASLLYPPIKASLEIFNKTSMEELRAKSKLLTAYLEYCIIKKYGRTDGMASGHLEKTDANSQQINVHILTPSDPEHRGAQLSLSFSVEISHVFQELEKRGVICDERKPSVIRVSPAPLYCSFNDVHRFMGYLDQALESATVTAA